MLNNWNRQWLPALPGLTVAPAIAAPMEGELASNTAGLLVVLGVLAIVMGIRSLRLRSSRLQGLSDRQGQTGSPAKHRKAPNPGR